MEHRSSAQFLNGDVCNFGRHGEACDTIEPFASTSQIRKAHTSAAVIDSQSGMPPKANRKKNIQSPLHLQSVADLKNKREEAGKILKTLRTELKQELSCIQLLQWKSVHSYCHAMVNSDVVSATSP